MKRFEMKSDAEVLAELKAILDEAKADIEWQDRLNAALDKCRAVVDAFRKSEVTYSRGDRFIYGGREFLLAGHTNGRKVVMTELSSGVHYSSCLSVADNMQISKSFMGVLLTGFTSQWTRTWDFQKQVEC